MLTYTAIDGYRCLIIKFYWSGLSLCVNYVQFTALVMEPYACRKVSCAISAKQLAMIWQDLEGFFTKSGQVSGVDFLSPMQFFPNFFGCGHKSGWRLKDLEVHVI